MNTLFNKLRHLSFARKVAEEKLAGEQDTLANAESRVLAVEQAQVLTQMVAEQVQANAHKKVASITTRCLKAVFGKDSYDFVIDFERKRGKTEAELKFVKDGMELDPMDSSGGGVIDVAAFGLRLAGLVSSRPTRRRFLCLDESFKHLSRNYSERAREMLEVLTDELGFQVILVTHNPRLRLGKVVQL